MSIKDLRKQALNLIKKNTNNIDGRSIFKYSQIAHTGQRGKVSLLIKTLKQIDEPKVIINTNHLDKDINDNVPHTPKPIKKKMITLKDVFKKHIPMVNIDVEFVVNYDLISYKKGKQTTFKNSKTLLRSLTIPKQKINDMAFIKYELQNLDSYDIETDDSLKISSITGLDILKKPVNTTDMFSQQRDLKNIRMKHATFVNLDIAGLKNYKFTEFQCVYGALKQKYNFEKEELLEIFQNYLNRNHVDNEFEEGRILKLSDGVSTNMIKYLAEIKDFSFYALDNNKKLFDKRIRKSHNNKAFVYVLHNEHLYLIDDEKEISSISEGARDNKRVSSNMFRECENKNPFLTLPIIENIEVSDFPNQKSTNIIYSIPDLYNLLVDIYNKFNFQIATENIKLNSEKKVIYFYYKTYDLHIWADTNYDADTGRNYKDIKLLCEKLKIDFNNQSITSIVVECEQRFFNLKSQRQVIRPDQKTELMKACDNKCIKCKTALIKGSYQYDHIIPLAAGGSNEIQNVQILCIKCHYEKTKAEQDNGEYIYVNKSESSFNNEIKNVYNSDNSKVFAFVERVSKTIPNDYTKLLHIDLTKTRRNILLYNKRNLPVHSVMDKIEKFLPNDIIKTGLYYVETKCYFPIRGNGWYSHNIILHLLETEKIKMSDIKFQIIASLELEADYFKSFFSYIVDNFGEFAKVGPNALIGLFNKKSTIKSRLFMTSSYDQAVSQFFNSPDKFVKHDIDSDLYCIYENKFIEFDESRCPLYKYIVEQEAIELDILKSQIESCGGIVVRYNTDCISAYFQNDHKINEIVDSTYWDDEKTVKKYKYEIKETFDSIIRNDKKKISTGAFDNNVKSDTNEIVVGLFGSDISYYKKELNYHNTPSLFNPKEKKEELEVEEVITDKFHDKMKGYCRESIYAPNINRKYEIIPDSETNDFTAQVEQIVTSNESIFINGRAGTGKSTLLKKIIAKLGKSSFIALAPTNKAALIINGQTIHKFLAGALHDKMALSNKLKGIDYIIIDEISMVKELFYKVFLSIKRLKPNIKFIVCGDFLQLKPVNDRFDYDYESSPALFELCDGNRLNLTKCRRADSVMFDLCNPLTIQKVDIKQFSNKFTGQHLSFTNKKRIEINEKCMKIFIKKKREEAIKLKKKQPVPIALKKLQYDQNSQDVELLAGMPLIAKINCKAQNISNNETFKIDSIWCSCIIVISDSTNEKIIIDFVDIQKLFYVAFCITVHRSQGCTFDHPYTINEWSLFDKRLKYVALSRSTKKEYININ